MIVSPGSKTWRALCTFCWLLVLVGMFAPKQVVAGVEVMNFDKVLHLGALATMMTTARLAFPRTAPFLFWPWAVLIAIFLELAQPVVQPSREFSFLDMAANVLGVGVAALLLWGRAVWFVRRG